MFRIRQKLFAALIGILCIFASLRLDVASQVRPIYDRGAVGLMQILKRLNTTASVLMIGAHPDDEDTALLTYLARGENARTAYLSLTRGDGGQNIIGPELGEALGVIRTEELLQARKLDGAEQYFTRAYDFGFSKTLEEARQKWDEKVILCDTVRVIRNFRPLVVVSQFSGTPADGHGQHQFAGYISPLAVKAAADASQCIDTGPVWQVKKFYVRHRGQGEPTLRINTGKYDPLLGRSYFEIAMEARSQHKSQEQGVLELRGDQFSSLNLQGSQIKEVGLFQGLDLSIRGLGVGSKDFQKPLSEIHELAEKAWREFDPRSPENVLPDLVKGYRVAHEAGLYVGTDSGYSPAAEYARLMAQQFVNAIVAASGLQVDALAEVDAVAAGEAYSVSVKAYSPLNDVIKVKNIELAVPAKFPVRAVANMSEMEWWMVKKSPPPTSNSPAFVSREVGLAAEHFTVTVPRDANWTSPYWLVDPREGAMFSRSGPWPMLDLPVQRPFPIAMLTCEINGTVFYVDQPVEFRFADDIRGEIRRNVDVVPKVTVEMDRSLMIVPYSDKPQTKQVLMAVTNHSSQPVTGTASLNFDSRAEWKYNAPSKTFELKRTGERTVITFDVTIPAKTKPGSYQIYGQAIIGETVANLTMKTIAYPHIQTHRYYRPAVVDAKVIDLKTAPIKVGYIAGSGDRVQDAIKQMGFNVETISENELATGNLSRFDAIIVGIRAYQVRPDLVANNKRLLDFANAGGTLIVQYQLPGYTQQNLAPFPAQQGPRVADELARVTILDPNHPIFNTPNKITEADFQGWVQERNLYNFSTMDAKYTGLLESHDANEPENKGGLVVADVGKGKYIYCSYSLFRQLPAGVPGAYRLLANMLAYSGKKPRSR